MARIIIFIIFYLIFVGQVWSYTEDHYVCEASEAAAGAHDGSNWANCFDGFADVTWDTDVADDGNVGPDDVLYLRDDDGVYRETLTIGAGPGLINQPITIMADTGESPIISGADVITGFTLDGGVANVYNATVTTEANQVFFDNVRLYEGASKAALADHEWFWDSNVLSIRDDSGDPDDQGYVVTASQRDYGIDGNGQAYITVDGLTVIEVNEINIYFPLSATDIIIDNCTSSNAFQNGIKVQSGQVVQRLTISDSTFNWCGADGVTISKLSTDWTITRNNIHNNCQVDGTVGDQGWCAGVRGWSYDSSIADIKIEYNNVYSNGIRPDDSTASGPRGVGIWPDTFTGDYNNVIRYNRVYDNDLSGIWLEVCTYMTVHNNLIFNNGYYGLYVSARSIDSLPSTNNKVYNNVVYSNGWNGIEVSGDIDGTPDDNASLNNEVKNNISMNNGWRELSAVYGGENDGTKGSGNVYEYNSLGVEASNFVEWGKNNFYSTYNDWEASYGGTTNSLEVDPQMTNPGSDDFTLQSVSSAIGAGTDLGNDLSYGLDPDSTWPDNVTSVNQDNYGDWEIGAYVYTTAGLSATGLGLTIE